MKIFRTVFAFLFVLVLAGVSIASASGAQEVPQSSCVQTQVEAPVADAQTAGIASLDFSFQSECHQIICSSNAECQGPPCIAAYCDLWFLGIQGNCAEW